MALRLAVQTVALLLVMLMALEALVYITTQHALLDSLETTLRDRAHPPPGFVGHPGYFDSDQGGGGQGPPPPMFHEPGTSEASTVFLNPALHRIGGGGGALGATVVDLSAARQALRTGREECCDIHAYEGQDYLVYTRALRNPSTGTISGVVQVSISAHQYESTLNSLRRILLGVLLVGLLVSGVISIVLTRRALRPIRIASQRQRDFVADAAHELRTPLTVMRTVGEVTLAGDGSASPEDLQGTIEQMLVENRHLARLVDDLSLLARADSYAVSLHREPADLSALVAGTVSELEPVAEAQGVSLGAEVEGGICVIADVGRIRQLLLILLDNALKHTPEGGSVCVRLVHHGSRASLEVADTGPGIPPGDLSRVFDRFYRSDHARAGEGTGLGLAIGKWIAEAHGGHIHAANGPQRGAVFTVTLPTASVPIPS